MGGLALAELAQLEADGSYNPNAVPDENRYKLNERTLAGYVQGKLEFDGGQVVAGVRVERFMLDNVGKQIVIL